jgi:[ribosomal protein S5]-alanine N-acetyltransferase
MQVTLRPFVITDLDSLVRHADNAAIAEKLNDHFPHPYTRENGKAFIEMTMKQDPRTILAIVVDGQACGAIGIHPLPMIERKNAEMGYWLGQAYWNKGIITRAIGQMVEYGFAHFDINRIFARPFGTNIASQRVLEKAGFQLEAKFEKTFYKNGQYIDELIYAIRRND